MDDRRTMTRPESDTDTRRGVGLDFHFPRHLDCSQQPAGLCTLLSLLITGLGRINYNYFLQLRPEYCVYCVGGKVAEFINPQLVLFESRQV